MPLFLADTFTDPNGTLLQTHVGELGAGWANINAGSNATIQANRCQGPLAGSAVRYRATGVPADADYSVFAERFKPADPVNSNLGICGRMAAAGADPDHYTVFLDQPAGFVNPDIRARLFKKVAGVYTQLGLDQTVQLSTGETKLEELRMVGTAIAWYWDGVQVFSEVDAAVAGPGRVGLVSFTGTTTHLDRLYADDVPGGEVGRRRWWLAQRRPIAHGIGHRRAR